MSFVRQAFDPVVLAIGIAASLSPGLWWGYVAIDVASVVFALWLVSPFALIVLLRRTGDFSYPASAATTLLLAALAVALQVDIHRSDSSTAGLGLLFYPFWFGGVVTVAWTLDLGLRAVKRWFASRPPNSPSGERAPDAKA